MKLKLKQPVKVGDGPEVTELVFREKASAGDLRGVVMRTEPLFDDYLKVGGRLCGQPDTVMNQLSIEDFGAVIEFVAPLFQPGQKT
jgi:hypothetical protein